ncbi:acyltransferase family protein [Algibacter sp.]|uniref:acyltransferase family protein n=1 Tax=Algibacter sp. TaxID=1872428 RepID=UPI003C72DCC4
MNNLIKIDINPNRIFGLDILRAVAILFVVAGHGGNLVEYETYKYINYFIFDGVSIFFVLSGFLIGGILIKILNNHVIDLKLIVSFWIRRWFRTLPNYFLILIIIILLNIIFNQNFVLIDKLNYFIFSQNLFTGHPDFFPEAWSLTIEEWFYLLIPIILYILIKGLKLSIDKAIIMTVIGIIISVTFFRYYRFTFLTVFDFKTWVSLFPGQVSTRLDSLMYGILGAYIYSNYLGFWKKYKVHFFILGLFLFLTDKFNFFNFNEFELYDSVFSFSIISMATLFLLPFLSLLKTGNGFFYKYLTYISLISYSMYLVNYTLVLQWIIIKIDWTALQEFNSYLSLMTKYFLFWFLTIALSIIIYKHFEIPIMNLRDRIKLK